MIAVDAMGGDFAPRQAVLGAFLAAKTGIPVALFGSQDIIFSLLHSFDPCWQQYKISVFHTDEHIGMAESPAYAVRKKTNSSIVQGIQSVKNGKCRAFISAGNSGAVAIAAMFHLGLQQGIKRPAMIGLLKTKKQDLLCLDIGANADCKPEHLLQFALMADNYAKNVLGRPSPQVALLSNGHEEGKGSLVVKETFVLLKKENSIQFFGNVEPGRIFDGDIDILVTDGFSGNILLKTIEALVKVFGVNNYEIAKDGALLLGVNGCVVVAHGDADAQVIKNAISLAFKSSLNKGSLYGTEKSTRRVST